VTPYQPQVVSAFVRRDAAPTSTRYDWLLTPTNNYTLYLLANRTAGAKQIFIGVAKSMHGTSFVDEQGRPIHTTGWPKK